MFRCQGCGKTGAHHYQSYGMSWWLCDTCAINRGMYNPYTGGNYNG